MDKQYILEQAKIINEYLLKGTPANIRFSWGWFKRPIAIEFKEMPSLMFEVRGRLHKGNVVVAYNAGVDYYEIYLINRKGVEKKVAEDVGFDQLGNVIDHYVETGNMTDKEYSEFANKELIKLVTK